MLRLTKQEAYEMLLNGTKVEVSKKPTHVIARWMENFDLCTKASGVVENERKNVTGWLVQPQHDKKNLYVLDDEQMRKRYSPSATDSYLYENGEGSGVVAAILRYWQFAKKHGAAFISVPQKKSVVFVTQDITFPDPWEGGDFTLLAGGVLVDNGNNSVYGINPVEFWNTHERVGE